MQLLIFSVARVTFLKRGFRPLPPCGSCPVLLDKTQTEEQGIKRHAHRSLVPPLAASLTPPFLALGFQQGPRWYFLVFSSNKLPQAKRRVLKQHKLEQLTVLEVQEPPQAPLGSSPGVPGLLSRLETPGETLCWFLEASHMPRLTAAPPAPKPQQDNRRLYLGRRFPLLRTLVITLNSPGWVARPPLPIGQLISTTNSTCSRPAPTRCRLIGKLTGFSGVAVILPIAQSASPWLCDTRAFVHLWAILRAVSLPAPLLPPPPLPLLSRFRFHLPHHRPW